MSAINLLLSPTGRIGKRQFWQGVVILVAAQLIMTGISLLFVSPTDASGPMGMLISFGFSIAYFYVYLCVYGKRLHDAGTSAWWYLLMAFGWIALYLLTIDFFYGIFGSSFWEPVMQSIELTQSQGEAASAEFMEAYALENKYANAYGGGVQAIVLNLIVGLIPGVLLSSDPFENMHGEPVGGTAEEFE